MAVHIVQQQRTARQTLAMALGGVLAIGLVAFAIDVTTIRITPDLSTFKVPTYHAYPGERIHVELNGGWSTVRSSNPAAVAPMGGDWFIAAGPGQATLSAATLRCPQCAMATVLWRADIRVGLLPGL